MSEPSRLRVTDDDGITRIEFVDRNILDEANIRQIGEEIGQLIEERETPRMLISFDNVDHMSSAALGALITINNKIKAKSGQLRLSDIDEQIYQVFVITKLYKLFDIDDNSEQGMAAFT
ncbi:MAG: STAS domain-containing protein [Phycisphaerales bacterium]